MELAATLETESKAQKLVEKVGGLGGDFLVRSKNFVYFLENC